jgi:predicted RNA-binding Zn-ribbon protein involved in translation (DUF1610 family)
MGKTLPDKRLKPPRSPSDTAIEMTTIRTTCPRCGEVDMGPEAILLSVLQGGVEGTYKFVCPQCMDSVEKRADRKIVALLVSAGVDVDASRAQGAGEPARAQTELFDDEIASLERRPEGPPFTIDDVIRFHFQLQDDRFLEQLLSS